MNESKVNEIARDVQEVLADLGVCQQVRAGQNRIIRVAPSIRRAVMDQGEQHLALHFDSNRLPRNVSAATLRQQQIADKVARRIGKAIQVRGDEEVVYVVTTQFAPAIQVSQ